MKITFTHHRRSAASRQGFTLVELLIAITILAMLSALSMSMLRNVAEYSRIDRAKVMVKRLDSYVMERYNGYQTRTVPIRFAAGTSPQVAAQTRLQAIRELMRLELPDRQGDLDYPNATVRLQVLTSVPSAARAMRRKIAGFEAASGKTWSAPNEGAECLYLILATMQSDGKSVLDVFSASEIGDTDNDGVPEILDPWGVPIVFIRWPAGFLSDAPLNPLLSPNQLMVTSQIQDGTEAPDPFDPLKVDPRWSNASSTFKPFALKPLICSCGQDREIGLVTFDYDPSAPGTIIPLFQYDQGNDPYIKLPNCQRWLAEPFESGEGYQDNITNHYVETP